MKLHCDGTKDGYEFIQVSLVFEGNSYQEAFSQKNNKSVAETLEHKRYAKLKEEVIGKYPDALDKPLGIFLIELKQAKNGLYKRFLNKYGDLTYSYFKIKNSAYLNSKGIYAYLADNELKYIGRCKDSMRKRVNQGYGKIHPKNCYLDGQATNCHLNARITEEKNEVTLWLHEMDSVDEIDVMERELIHAYAPPWNIQRG